MTTDELPGAGPELDRLVAEALKPRYVTALERVSVDDYHALLALETWRGQHPDWAYVIHSPELLEPRDYVVELWHEGDGQSSANYGSCMGPAPTLAVAICHAIVLAGRAVQG